MKTNVIPAVLLALVACSSPPEGTVVGTDPARELPPSIEVPPASSTAPPLSDGERSPTLVQSARGYLGVPYRYGGTNPRAGFDCSGLVQRVYRDNGLRVPRTAAQQFRATQSVPLREAQPGDLVFFGTGTKVDHVGIYLGGANFIHASTGKGRVRVDRLDKGYFRQRFVGAGHVPASSSAR